MQNPYAAPKSDADARAPATSPMTVVSMLFPSRIGRFSFVLRVVVVVALAQVAAHFADARWPIPVLGGYGLAFVHAPRMRDVGFPGRAALLLFLPIVNLLVSVAALVLRPNWWTDRKKNDGYATPKAVDVITRE